MSVGKKIGSVVYIHKSAADYLSLRDAELLQQAERTLISVQSPEFNVIKIDANSLKVSFLQYENFFEDPFPALRAAATIKTLTASHQIRSYQKSCNSPILHRKELLLSPTNPNQFRFREMTASLEELGLYSEAHKIGHLRQWAERLARADIGIQDHRVVTLSETPELSVEKPW